MRLLKSLFLAIEGFTLNYVFALLSSYMSLPVFLDFIGTCYVSIKSLYIGVLTSIVYSIYMTLFVWGLSAAWVVLAQISTALITYLLSVSHHLTLENLKWILLGGIVMGLTDFLLSIGLSQNIMLDSQIVLLEYLMSRICNKLGSLTISLYLQAFTAHVGQKLRSGSL